MVTPNKNWTKDVAETDKQIIVENWQKMIAACAGFGGDYQPTKANLALASMSTPRSATLIRR